VQSRTLPIISSEESKDASFPTDCAALRGNGSDGCCGGYPGVVPDGLRFLCGSYGGGAAALAADDIAGAVAAYECARLADPYNPEVLVALADAHILAGEFPAAVNYLVTSISWYVDPEGEFREAETERRRAAVEAAPDDLQAQIRLATWLWAFDDEAALPVYEAGLAIEPDNLALLTFQASSLIYRQESEAAQPLVDRLLEEQADNINVLLLLALSYTAIDDRDTAQALLDQAAAIDPEHPYYFAYQGVLYVAEENWQGVVDMFVPLSDVFPVSATNYNRYITLGMAYIRLGDEESANRWFEEAMTMLDVDRFVPLHIAWELHDVGSELEGIWWLRYAQEVETERGAETAITIGEPLTLEMTDGRVYYLAFEATAGEVLTLTASTSDTYDPLIVLIDAEGNVLAWNDDVSAEDDYSSLIADWEVPVDGSYTLIVTHSGLGSEGPTEVSITAQ
jgi:tetratricopeptide (TPR) repeat protein